MGNVEIKPHESDANESKSTSNTEEKFTDKCICGAQLQLMTPTEAYGATASVTCDGCKSFVRINQIYHCPQGENEIHKHGYDLCTNCVLVQDANNNSRRREVTLGSATVPIQIDDKIMTVNMKVKKVTNDSDAEDNDNEQPFLPDFLLQQLLDEGQLVDYGPQFEPRGIDEFNEQVDAMFDGKQDNNSCNDPVTECVATDTFNKRMQRYHDMTAEDINLDTNDMIKLYNDYIHIIQHHDNDKEFEHIVQMLGICDVMKCQLFRRNHRNRAKIPNGYQGEDTVAYQELFDKIHCHFYHCYDIGNRLFIKDKEMISSAMSCNEIVDEKSQTDQIIHDEDDSLEALLINTQIQKTIQILHPRQQKYKLLRDEIHNDPLISKYCQLLPVQAKQTGPRPQVTEVKTTEVSNDDILIYHPGHKFYYTEKKDEEMQDYIVVTPKFDSLKEELLSNKYANTTIEQFTNEYKKAYILLHSLYFKKKYLPFIIPHAHEEPYVAMLEIKHVLVLMIYCNYDYFQAEFTRSYREQDEGEMHRYFWRMGKFLYDCIHTFGDVSYHEHLYHGISKRLMFEGFPGAHFEGVQINGPLSTSLSFGVSLSFTGNGGLIIEFGMSEAGMGAYIGSRYFWCDPISDFGNEKECLFLGTNRNFQIKDISERDGVKYGVIIRALYVIDSDIFGDKEVNADTSMCSLIQRIISNQLSYFDKSFAAFNSLSDYGKMLCDNYFKNKYDDIEVDYLKLKSLIKLLQYKKQRWIDLLLIYSLFMKPQFITIQNTDLNEDIMENILAFFHCKEKFIALRIKPSNHSLSRENAVNKYKAIFDERNIVIYTDEDDDDEKDNQWLIIGRVRPRYTCWFHKYNYHERPFSKLTTYHLYQLVRDIFIIIFENDSQDGNYEFYQRFLMDQKIDGKQFCAIDEKTWISKLDSYSSSYSHEIAETYYHMIKKHEEECVEEEEEEDDVLGYECFDCKKRFLSIEEFEIHRKETNDEHQDYFTLVGTE